jgi:hypothetical protein
MVFWSGIAIVFGGYLWQAMPLGLGGAALIVASLAMPGRIAFEERAVNECREAARRELERRVSEFTAACEAANDASVVRAALALQTKLGLTDDEAGAQRIEVLKGYVELDDLEATTRPTGKLAALEGHEVVTTPDACYFYASGILYDKRGENDPTGELFLTDARLLFLAPDGLTATPWSKVIRVSHERRTISVQRRDRQTPYVFYFKTWGEALRAEWITKNIMAKTAEAART